MRALIVVTLLATAISVGCFGRGCDGEGTVRVIEGPDGGPIEGATLAPSHPMFDKGSTTTDEEGRGSPPDGSFVVSKEGYLHEEGCLREGEPEPVISLYRTRLSVSLNGTLAGGDAGTNQLPDTVPDRWDAQEVSFGGSALAKAEYAKRLRGLNVTLTWNNTLLSGAGDLAVGLGKDPETALFWQDSDSAQVQMGPKLETLSVTVSDFDERWQGATRLYAGAGAGKAYASATGIPYALAIEAYFGHPMGSPGVGIALLLAGIGLAAFLLRRDRRA